MIYQFFNISDHNQIPINRRICMHKDCSGNCVNSWTTYGRTSLQGLFLMLMEILSCKDMFDDIKNNIVVILEYDDQENFCRIVPKIEFEKFLILI